MKGFTVPDIIYPADNADGIPDLLIDVQPDALTLPFTRWGEISRSVPMQGTYHFYTDDYKFEHVWTDPEQVLRSGCKAVVESNWSAGDATPRTVMLWDIYRKRWLSRYWQSFGVKIWVDLNVPVRWREVALLGVPHGWRAFCTRGLSTEVSGMFSEYEMAVAHAAPHDPLFMVYGGGQLIEALCLQHGWLWQPENMHVKDGRRLRRPGLQLRIVEVYYGKE